MHLTDLHGDPVDIISGDRQDGASDIELSPRSQRTVVDSPEFPPSPGVIADGAARASMPACKLTGEDIEEPRPVVKVVDTPTGGTSENIVIRNHQSPMESLPSSVTKLGAILIPAYASTRGELLNEVEDGQEEAAHASETETVASEAYETAEDISEHEQAVSWDSADDERKAN